MSFLANVKIPGGGAAAAPTGSSSKSKFLSGVDIPTPEEAAAAGAVHDLQQENQISAAQAEYANSFTGIAKQTFHELAAPFVEGYKAAAMAAPEKSLDPRKAAKVVTDSFAASLSDAGDKVYEAAHVLGDSHAGLLQKGVSVGEAALGALGPIFTGLTAPLTYASSYPGIGHVADKVNELFSALGSGASRYATVGVVDRLPVSEQTKDTIRPLVGDIAALAAQLYAGKAGGHVIGTIADKSRTVMKTVADDVKSNPTQFEPAFRASEPTGTLPERLAATDEKKVPVYGDTTLRPLPVAGESIPTDIPFSNDYRPGLPDIPVGTVPKGMPSIEFSKPKARGPGGGMVYEPIDTPAPATAAPQGAFLKGVLGTPETPSKPVPGGTEPVPMLDIAAAQNGTLKPVQSTGETLPSRLAANVEANAIEKNLTNSLGDLPEYNRVNMKEQAQHAATLLVEDPSRALRIALGQELPPNHILPEAVFTAVENRAVKAGDILTLRRLAQESTLSTEATAMGQRIRALGERDQDSPVKIIQDVQKARTESIEKKTGQKVAAVKKADVADIKKEITANASKRPTWEEFVQELTCNI